MLRTLGYLGGALLVAGALILGWQDLQTVP
jgi:hypothetical protein